MTLYGIWSIYFYALWYASCELRWTDNSDDGRGWTDERVEISTELDDGQSMEDK